MDKEFVWHPYTQMKDWSKARAPMITSGRSFELVDSEGNGYLDGIANMWCNVWGHDQNPVTQAIADQFNKMPHSTLFGLASESSARLSAQLVRMAKGMHKVFFTDNGSCAIEAAMKMALQYWHNRGKKRKSEFISLEHGYHGDTAGAMSVGYIEQFFGSYKPMLHNYARLPVPSSSNLSSHTDQEAARCIEAAERLLSSKADRCAALVMESGAQIAGGAIIYPEGFQESLAALCRKYDVLLILDEIATGFGRLGNMVEYIEQKSTPDIACFGKALTGGYFPLAVTLATEEIFNSFLAEYQQGRQFYHGHTFTGHAAGCAAATANIELYKKDRLISKIRSNSKHLKSRLTEFERFNLVSDIRQKGLLAAIEIGARAKTPQKLVDGTLMNYFIMKRSLELGVFLRPLGNNLLLVPPLAMPRTDIDRLVDAALTIVLDLEKLVR